MAAATITQMPSAANPTTIASAVFCFSTSSFQRLKGVRRSTMKNATQKIAMPRKAYKTELMMMTEFMGVPLLMMKAAGALAGGGESGGDGRQETPAVGAG